ncbi:MAG: DNA cytosine methyltransferase [Deltaproteobacteria bacterium]|jgi:DNA (cytosine-5)-methyltransferase 1|nr:DNA cytosine methyltransferase [Deltaproteobacteria bacterium]
MYVSRFNNYETTTTVEKKPRGRTKTLSLDKPGFLEFFSGSGLVSHALARHFSLLWANDICPKKALVFCGNHEREKFHRGSITAVSGLDLPPAALSWASFPCQDLSVAGKAGGLQASRSGLVWEWLRVMDEMPAPAPVLVAENVVGLVSRQGGRQYRQLHAALAERGYRVGAFVLDAVRWLPQSRPRIFIVAARQTVKTPPELLDAGPNWLHSKAVVAAARGLDDWLWWKMPEPRPRSLSLSEVVDWDAPCFDDAAAQKTLALIPASHWRRFLASGLQAAPGYKRIRQKRQVLELRFDDVAGCLRTPQGGSSRQYLVIREADGARVRLLTVDEIARLMGAPASYKLPGGYNDVYKAMGDAAAVPVVAYLARHLLSKLAAALSSEERALTLKAPNPGGPGQAPG